MSDSEELVQLTTSPVETTTTNGAKRGRGRPKKSQKAVTTKQQTKSTIDNGVSDTNGTNGSESETSTLPKKRGRKPKADPPIEVKTSGATTAAAKRGRGRPKKSQSKAGRPPKRGRKAAKNIGRNESDEDEAEPNDDNTGDEEERPEDEEDDD